jgi:hypothetical protein
MNVIAVVYSATPLVARRRIMGFTAIQPGSMPRAPEQIHTRFLDEIRLLGSIHYREIAVEQIVTNAAAVVIAVIRRQEFTMSLIQGRVPRDPFAFEVHAAVVSGTERLQIVAKLGL